MKIRVLLLAVLSLLPSGCGFVGHTLGTVTSAVGGIVKTVTSPISGVLNAAEPGAEKAWREKAAAEKRKKIPTSDDRRSTSSQRRD